MDSKNILLIIFVIIGFGLSTFLFYDKTKLNSMLNHEIDTLNSIIASNDLLITEKNEEIAGLKTTNEDLKTHNEELNKEVDLLRDNNYQLELNINVKESQYESLQNIYESLNNNYASLQKKYEMERMLKLTNSLSSFYDHVRYEHGLAGAKIGLTEAKMVKFEAKLVHHDLGHSTWLSIESEYYKDIGVQSYSAALGKIQATLNYSNIQRYDTSTEKISKILDFINEYVVYQEEFDNIIRSPVETLSLASGDGEEFAMLAAALFKSSGIDTAIALLKNVDDIEYSLALVHLEKLNITNYHYEKPYHIFQDLTKHGLKPGSWILIDPQTRIRFQGSPEIDEYFIKAAVEIESLMS